jgi:hypothetical protein
MAHQVTCGIKANRSTLIATAGTTRPFEAARKTDGVGSRSKAMNDSGAL